MAVVQELQWDEANEAHIARHAVVPEEVEEICFGPHWALRAKGGKRRALFGQTRGGRYLMVVLELVGRGAYRPVTARDMSHRERRRYRSSRGRS
jgi:uncharacterized DUF497 family protein